MRFTALEQAPPVIYLLPYRHEGIALSLACLPDGGLLRSRFAQGDDAMQALRADCTKRWPQAVLQVAPPAFQPDLAHAHLYGTPFQQAVWRTLTAIPAGSTLSYGQLALQLGQPTACRAVGAAVGANPFAPFVPCHRVLAAEGRIGGFIGGPDLKRSLLQTEGVTAR